MPDREIRVKFQPQGRECDVLPGSGLLEAAAQVGLAFETPCGGGGKCGKCRVQLMEGAAPPGTADRTAFGEAELAAGWRLACQCRLTGNTVVYAPAESLFGSRHQIQTDSSTGHVGDLVPLIRCVPLELPEPSLGDGSADLARLSAELGVIEIDLPFLRELPGRLRAAKFRGTAVLAGGRLLDFFEPDARADCLGVALDIGTTTLAGALIDLNTGEELAVTARMNTQVRHGDDVLSRIRFAGEPGGLESLARAVREELSEMITALCRDAGKPADQVFEIVCSGNTTMEHLLCGIDPRALGQVPFVSSFAHGLEFPAALLELPAHPRARAYVYPVIGGFVGGDTVAGMLCTRLDALDGPALFVDIGTNGEIVLAHGGVLRAASTAAGPAFEGARISCGMRAARGAIEKVVVDGDLHCGVIGDTRATGICGSGLIDAVAELLRHGVISPQGRVLAGDELPPGLSDALRRRVRLDDRGEPEIVLADGATPVTLTQRDIRELQLASGAIRAGIAILLKQAGLVPSDLAHIFVAGGFGSFIRRRNAQQIGILPHEVARDRIRHVGNTSLSGARWALLSTEARRRAEYLAEATQHVELSMDPDFDVEFAMAMFFHGPGEA